ncbi:MAG: hypothetical protein ACQES9_02050 [Myxococcota bacterium]
MKIFDFIYILLFISILTFPVKSEGNIKIIKNSLQQGIKECKNSQFDRGINRIINAAMDLRKNHPKHSLNRKWRSYLKFCYKRWSVQTRKQCYKNNDFKIYSTFEKISEKAKYTASKITKRMIKNQQKKCFNSLQKHFRKNCKKDSDLLNDLSGFLKYLKTKNKTVGKLPKIQKSCLKNHWGTLMDKCKKDNSIQTLKKVYLFRKKMPDKGEIRKEYSNCLINLIQLSADECQKEMKYSKGSKLINKTIKALKRTKFKKKKFLKKALNLKRKCGIYTINLNLNMKTITGGIKYNLPVTTNLTVVQNSIKNKKVKACGELEFKSVKTKRGKCKILVTVNSPPKTKNHIICYQGKILKKRGQKHSYLKLAFQKKSTEGNIQETIHKTCKKGNSYKTVSYFKENLFMNLLSKKHLNLKIKSVAGEKEGFLVPLDLGKGRKVTFKGFYTISNIK